MDIQPYNSDEPVPQSYQQNIDGYCIIDWDLKEVEVSVYMDGSWHSASYPLDFDLLLRTGRTGMEKRLVRRLWEDLTNG